MGLRYAHIKCCKLIGQWEISCWIRGLRGTLPSNSKHAIHRPWSRCLLPDLPAQVHYNTGPLVSRTFVETTNQGCNKLLCAKQSWGQKVDVLCGFTHFGGENLKRGMITTLEIREIPRKIQESFTLSNAALCIGNENGCPPFVAILACEIIT